MKQIIILSIVFICGLLIFTYPIVSNWFQTKEHYTVIQHHYEALETMSEKEITEEKEKAEKYNTDLRKDPIAVTDPFAENNRDARKEVSAHYYDALNIGNAMAYLEIPAIDSHLPIYHGISDDVLQQGIGHMENSSFPVGGEGTHAALTGHRGLPSSKLFRHLDKVKKKDLFYIHTLGEVLTYEVDQIDIVLPSETTWLTMEENEDYVTLITCEPYMINTHRLLVRGKRIDTVTSADNSEAVIQTLSAKNTQINIYLWLGIFLISCGLIVLFYRYYKRRGME